MCHFSPLHFSASSLSIVLPYRFRLQSYVHSLMSLLLCAAPWQLRHNVIRFSIRCMRLPPMPAGTIWCMFTPCLPQCWHMPSSRSKMALISFFGIGFLPDVRLWVGLGIMRTPSPFRTVPSDFRLAADSAFQTTVQ